MGLEEGGGRDERGDVAGEDVTETGCLVDSAVKEKAALVFGHLAPARLVVLGACNSRQRRFLRRARQERTLLNERVELESKAAKLANLALCDELLGLGEAGFVLREEGASQYQRRRSEAKAVVESFESGRLEADYRCLPVASNCSQTRRSLPQKHSSHRSPSRWMCSCRCEPPPNGQSDGSHIHQYNTVTCSSSERSFREALAPHALASLPLLAPSSHKAAPPLTGNCSAMIH